MMKTVLSVALMLTVGLTATAQKNTAESKKEKMKTSNKEKAVAFTAGFKTNAFELLSYLHPKKYTEHDVNAADGVEGFEGLLRILPKDSPKPKIVRAIQDGDIVFTHTEYNFFGPQVAIDIFRFEDDLIAEHWDNIQGLGSANPSGHTMIDGPSQIKELDKTQANKALVRSFVEDIFVNGKRGKLAGYFNGNNLIQHSALIGDEVSSLEKALDDAAKNGTPIKYNTIHKVLGEGNFVLVVSEGYLEGKHTSFYDLFRVENGKIAEHWDIIQEIPAKDTWKNSNGKF